MHSAYKPNFPFCVLKIHVPGRVSSNPVCDSVTVSQDLNGGISIARVSIVLKTVKNGCISTGLDEALPLPKLLVLIGSELDVEENRLRADPEFLFEKIVTKDDKLMVEKNPLDATDSDISLSFNGSVCTK